MDGRNIKARKCGVQLGEYRRIGCATPGYRVVIFDMALCRFRAGEDGLTRTPRHAHGAMISIPILVTCIPIHGIYNLNQ